MIRDLDDKRLGQNSDFSLSPLLCRLLLVASFLSSLLCSLFLVVSSLSPLFCHLFFVASSLSPHLARFLARLFASCSCFYLRSSVGLAVGLAIKWPAAFPSSAAGPSRRKSSYRRLSHRRSSYCESVPSESYYYESKLSQVNTSRVNPLRIGPSKVRRQ